MISQWYPPETGSAAHPAAIAEALHRRGHAVDVLTGFPSYPSGRVHSGYRMSFRQHEEVNGVRLLRVPDVPSHDDSALRRAASLTSFAASASSQVLWLRRADACLVYLTPATIGVAAMLLRALARVPYVLYVQDIWPDTVTASGFISDAHAAARVERLLSVYLHRLYRSAAGVAAISPTMAALLEERGARKPVSVVPNWVDEEVFSPANPVTDALPRDRRWVMYAGGIGEVQALEHAVRALARLSDRPDIGLALVGHGTALTGLQELASRLGVADRMAVIGHRAMAEMPALMAAADAQLVTLRDLPLFRGTIPSKVQAAMACGAPVVCAVAGDAADLVSRTGAGVVVPPEDSEALAGAFRKVADSPAEMKEMGRRGRAAYLSELGSMAGSARLETMLTMASQGRPG